MLDSLGVVNAILLVRTHGAEVNGSSVGCRLYYCCPGLNNKQTSESQDLLRRTPRPPLSASVPLPFSGLARAATPNPPTTNNFPPTRLLPHTSRLSCEFLFFTSSLRNERQRILITLYAAINRRRDGALRSPCRYGQGDSKEEAKEYPQLLSSRREDPETSNAQEEEEACIAAP